jgi:flagellar operon protein
LVQRIDIQGIGLGRPQSQKPFEPGEGFKSFLEKASSKLTLSAHAEERIRLRNIPFGPQEMARMEEAVEKAGKKGCRDSLVFLDNSAFVVSVRNKTVVTAMDGMNVKDNVFTNIDSAVVA